MSFPRYPAYKPTGVEWLGEVPEHWDILPLKRRSRLLTEKTECRDNPVALENIEGWTGRFIETDTEFQGEGIAFESGDILFGKLRPYLAKAYLAAISGQAVGDFHVIHPLGGLNSRFLQLALLTRELIDLVNGSTFGAKMPRASWDFLGSLPLCMPPLDEQHAIASFLDRETAKIDALIAEQQRLIELLQEKRQAVISDAVTKGLNPNAPMKDSGVEWLGEVPEHWDVLELKRLNKEGSSITYGIVQAGPHQEQGVPYIRTSDMSGDRLLLETCQRTSPEIDEAYARSRVSDGDLVIAIRATVGKALEVPTELDGANLTQGTAKFSPGERVTSGFMKLAFASSYCQTQIGSVAKGATFLEITLDALRRLAFAVPPKDEARQITHYLSERCAVLDTLTTNSEEACSLLKERRSALISAAVTGQIDVRGMVREAIEQ